MRAGTPGWRERIFTVASTSPRRLRADPVEPLAAEPRAPSAPPRSPTTTRFSLGLDPRARRAGSARRARGRGAGPRCSGSRAGPLAELLAVRRPTSTRRLGERRAAAKRSGCARPPAPPRTRGCRRRRSRPPCSPPSRPPPGPPRGRSRAPRAWSARPAGRARRRAARRSARRGSSSGPSPASTRGVQLGAVGPVEDAGVVAGRHPARRRAARARSSRRSNLIQVLQRTQGLGVRPAR